MNRTSASLILTTAIAGLASHSASGQALNAVDQSGQVNRREESTQPLLNNALSGETAPELFPGESDDVGPQYILKQKTRRTWFSAIADSQFFYTSNALLEEKGGGVNPVDSTLFVNTAQFAITPPPYMALGGTFAPRVGYRHQWYDYGIAGNSHDRFGNRLSLFDFDVQTVFAETRYRFAGNWVAEIGLDYQHMMSHVPSYDSYGELYQDLTPRWGLQKYWEISENQLLVAGYQGNFRFTKTPDFVPGFTDRHLNDRTEHAFIVSYSHGLTANLVVQPFYRFQIADYANDYVGANGFEGRLDYLNTVGVGVFYSFTPQISARAFVTYEARESSASLVADYRKVDIGGGVNLNFRF